eukprot:scaffold6707_cov110-Phaeocystis_antarctica.AAC.2
MLGTVLSVLVLCGATWLVLSVRFIRRHRGRQSGASPAHALSARRGKHRTPLPGTAPRANHRQKPGLSGRPLRDAQAWRAGRYDQPLAMRRRPMLMCS